MHQLDVFLQDNNGKKVPVKISVEKTGISIIFKDKIGFDIGEVFIEHKENKVNVSVFDEHTETHDLPPKTINVIPNTLKMNS